MRVEEAISTIAECKYCRKKIHGECTDDHAECFVAKQLAIDALEKQIPKKVLLDNYEGHIGKKCPACGKQVWVNQKFCETCGQAQDWG